MVVFHSYVKLPEGNFVFEPKHSRWWSMVLHVHQELPDGVHTLEQHYDLIRSTVRALRDAAERTGPTDLSAAHAARCPATTYPSKLVPCEFCKRTFHPERLETHQRVCGLVWRFFKWGFGWINCGWCLCFRPGKKSILRVSGGSCNHQRGQVYCHCLPHGMTKPQHESMKLPIISKIKASLVK